MLVEVLKKFNFFTIAPKGVAISQKLGSYLVRAKLYPLERTVGSWKCNKEQFKTFENVENSDTFRSSITSETFKINHWLICDDKYQVYLFTCKTC